MARENVKARKLILMHGTEKSARFVERGESIFYVAMSMAIMKTSNNPIPGVAVPIVSHDGEPLCRIQ